MTRRKFILFLIAFGVLIPEISRTANSPIPQTPVRGIVVAAGGGCTVNSGDKFNECFEGTGYESAWTEVSNPDEDAALTTAFARLGTQCLDANVTAGGTSYAYKDVETATASDRYFRFYFYIDSNSFVDTDYVEIAEASSVTTPGDTDNRNFTVRVRNVEGNLNLAVMSAVGSANIGVLSIDAWYRCEVKLVKNSATSEVKVFNSSDTQVGSTQGFTSNNMNFRYFFAGVTAITASDSAKIQIDGVGISTTGYLGQ